MNADLVIVGLGYVGLPLAQGAVRKGVTVVGLDVKQPVVDGLNGGRSHIDDLSDADIAEMLQLGFTATTDPSCIQGAGAVVICVPTPLDESYGPDLGAVEGASRMIRDNLRAGTLVVLESTTYPGTTDDVVKPILEESGLKAGVDFLLAYSPERIDPGNPVYGIENTPKVVGGIDDASTAAASALYGRFVQTVVPVRGTREAEMAKLLENTYRHVNIALVNEMAIFCHDLGIDLWESIRAAATKPFGFQAFYPGPGVGGHCIPIDPNYLSYRVRMLGYPFRFVELAQEVSNRMPAYVVNRAMHNLNDRGKALRGAKVLLLGVTYKKDISDERESPAQPVARRLIELGADVQYADPHVASWTIDGMSVPRAEDAVAAASTSDLTILLQAHTAFDLPAIVAAAPALLDTRGTVEGAQVERL
ncbi:MAG: nucleotide sugar dehydrogenase [Ilumatobacteraceae bacterium]